jgi:hypothetical protein
MHLLLILIIVLTAIPMLGRFVGSKLFFYGSRDAGLAH